jgi:hypothetical protein
MADLTEFSSLSWTESGQDLDGWGYPHTNSQNSDPTYPHPPIWAISVHIPMHSNLYVEG